MRLAWTQRRDRPWLAMSAVPLAMTASGLMQLWWLWPLLLLVATTCTSASRWSWVLTFQLAVFGTEWAYLGCVALAGWPASRFVVDALWAGVALTLAGAPAANRKYEQRPERKSRFG